jgi:microcystin-dependent protein
MSNQFLGEIKMISFNFPPKGWAFCNGQALSIQQNQALFSLLGTFYGGNGTTTFSLPNLQSSVPVHQGQGAGLQPYNIGQPGGSESVTLIQSTVPSHSHTFNVTSATATSAAIGTGLVPAKPTAANASAYAVSQSPPGLTAQTLASGACAVAGGSQPHLNLMPSLVINFCIALQGIFPSRS